MLIVMVVMMGMMIGMVSVRMMLVAIVMLCVWGCLL